MLGKRHQLLQISFATTYSRGGRKTVYWSQLYSRWALLSICVSQRLDQIFREPIRRDDFSRYRYHCDAPTHGSVSPCDLVLWAEGTITCPSGGMPLALAPPKLNALLLGTAAPTPNTQIYELSRFQGTTRARLFEAAAGLHTLELLTLSNGLLQPWVESRIYPSEHH